MTGRLTEDSSIQGVDGEWEDIPGTDDILHPEFSNTTTPSSRTASPVPRRRRPGAKMQFIAAPGPSPRKALARKDRAQPDEDAARRDALSLAQVQALGQQGAAATGTYAHGVLADAARYFGLVLRLAQKPIAALLVLYLLSFLGSYAADQVRQTFAPLCFIPGMSATPLCTRPAPNTGAPGAPGAPGPAQWANFTRLAEVQGRTFEELLADASGGSALALEIKQAEMATADLATLVRVSRLTSRDLIADALLEFVEDARKAGRGLQKFNAKVGGAVDSILAVNDYALHAIEAATIEANQLSIRSFIPWNRDPPAKAVILANFETAMGVMSANMGRLILEAETSLAHLGALEERLATLHGQLAHEDAAFSAQREELLGELWTKLGGNRRAIRSADAHARLLAELGAYRRRALAHVAGALQTLEGMEADMDELRARVAAPELAGPSIPPEVHMRAIRSGLERLREGRVRAKEVEESVVRRVLDAADADAARLPGA